MQIAQVRIQAIFGLILPKKRRKKLFKNLQGEFVGEGAKGSSFHPIKRSPTGRLLQ